MKNLIGVILSVAFVGMVSTVSADDVVPGAYGQPDWSVMSVGKTQMQIGASDRAHANYINTKSGAGRALSNAGNGGGADFQWGQSQTEQSWKAAKTIEEAQVRGLVPGDCGGENTTDAYRKQMNQNRKGYMSEPVISNAMCGEYHPTLQ
jgi:hypothetical protein